MKNFVGSITILLWVVGRSFQSPFEVNTCEVGKPKSLQNWIKLNEEIIKQNGRLELFDTETFKYKVFLCGDLVCIFSLICGKHKLSEVDVFNSIQ